MRFKLLLSFFIISVSLLAQEEHNHEIEIITDFISENGLSASEKLHLQCEYHLLYQQYQEESTLDSSNLLTAFQAILSTYRTTDTLDTSYRLKELEYDVSDTPRQSSELELFLGPHGSENYARSTSCINTDFESNNFDHWSMGYASDDGETAIIPGIDLGPMNGTTGNHAIMGPGAGNDAQTDNILPRVYPGGGQYSVRLGDEQGGYNAAKLSYTFNVTQATELFLYHYAVVMEDPGHDPAEQPFLRINLIINDTSISCGEYYQAASGNADGYTVVDGGFFGDDVLFKPWSTVSIALSPYIGQTATIEFTTSDCAQGGHFGYAYLDAECSSMPTLAEAQLDCSSPTTTIEGPSGAETYQWSGPGIVGSSTEQNVEVNEVGIYTVEVIPVQGPSCSYTREVEVVGNTSDATADFNAVPNEVCLGEEIEFEDLSTSSDPITGYEWQFGDGNSSTLTEPSHTYTTPGTYTVDLTINPLSDCSNTISKDVFVSPLPIADFMIDSVCFGESSSIQDLSSIDTINGNVIDNWNWDFGDGQTSTDANPTHQYGNENIFNIELIVTSNNGCINSVIKPTAVYPQPIVDFSATEECVQFITDFTNESTVNNTHTSNQNVSWNWDFDDGNTATGQNPSNLYANDGSYNVNLTVTTNHNCTADSTFPVVVNPKPTPDFDFTNACDNESILLESTSTSNASSITAYYWDIDNNSSVEYNTAIANHTYGNEGLHDVVHVVEDANGCRDTITQQITVYALPNANFDVDEVCEDATTTFENTSTITPVDNDVIDQYNWDFGIVPSSSGSTSTAENPTFNYEVENVYDAELIVTTNYGCKDTIVQEVTVYPLPVVDFSQTEVCVEFITDFTDESTVNNTHTSNQNVSWNWDFDDGNTATSQNPSNMYANDGSYNVNLTVTTNHNCTADSTFPVVVNPKPTPDFDFTNACDNESILLESTATSNASSITAYYWDIDNNSSVEYNTAIANHTYGNEGLHDVVHVVEDANGCRDTITQQITVYALPNANFDVDEVCEDATTTFENTSTITPVDNDVIDQYNWDFGIVPSSSGSTSTAENPTFNYEVENVYDAELIVTTNYGCKDTIVQEVTVYPLPVVDFSPTDVCLDETSQFTDQSLVSNAHTNNSLVSWNWDFDDGNTATSQNPSNMYANDGSYNVNLTVTTNHNCTADSTFSVVVNPKPTPDFDFTNACDNESILLESTATSNASSITAYYWDIDNNSSVDYNTAIANHTYGNEGLHDVVHVVEDANGCRDTITQQITVYALPNANFDVDEVCEDATTTFENTSTITPVDNDLIDQYNWDFGIVPSSSGSTSTAENPTFNYEVENVYDAELIVTTNYGCKDTIVQAVTVYPLPVVDFSPTDVCLGETSQFTDQSLVSNAHTNNSLVSWNWDFDDGTVSTVQNPSNTYSSDTTYSTTLEVTTNHGCINDTTKTVTVHPLPDVSFTGVNLAGCAPVCPTVTSTTTITSPSSVLQENWTLSDGQTYQGGSFTDCYENETGNTIYYGLNLTVTSSEGCVSSHYEDNYISVYHKPIANFYTTPYEIDIMDPEVSFHNTSIHADYYNWNIESYGSSSNVNPVVLFPSEPTTYDVELIASTDAGCTDTAYAAIEIKDRIIYYVPNTFTPDNDDYNEVFKPIFSSGYEPQSYTLYIFNRWGEMLFESHNTNVGWDGTYSRSSERIVRDGTYVWKIIFQETMSDKNHTVTGHVNVLR